MLKKSTKFAGVQGPVVCIVMDGIGISTTGVGDAIAAARKPIMDKLDATCAKVPLKAHGTAVGMPSDEDMGNSEVGHNALGAGQVYNQGASLVSEAIANRSLFEGAAWREIVGNAKANNSTLHLIGLFSDGNVHSHIDHLKALITEAKQEHVATVRVHALLDGRDVPETSALEYVEPFEAWCDELSDATFSVCIASGGGRMKITMDRYEADWSMVERGWKCHILGEGDQFCCTSTAIKALRESSKAIDQDLPAFVIAKDGKPVGTVQDHDSVVFFNFRGDRAIEITRAFEEGESFKKFNRVRVPKVEYAGMLQYDGDLKLPKRFLVTPPAIRDTMGEWLSKTGVTQFATSETQKYGHVTYFWNGNRSSKFEGETYQEVPSDVIPFEQRPWMKSAEIADAMIAALQSGKYNFLRCNFANGDMVGHTGNFRAATMAVEAVDLALARVLPVIEKLGGVCLITADHGNADEMYEVDKKSKQPQQNKDGSYKAKTAHTLNQVPCWLVDYATGGKLVLGTGSYGLSNMAATLTELMGYEPHAKWDESMLVVK
jgi:2,3-bisphosphoglycerate-independent phosphoglycerate mutase